MTFGNYTDNVIVYYFLRAFDNYGAVDCASTCYGVNSSIYNVTIDTLIVPNITLINFSSDGGTICSFPGVCAVTEDRTPTFAITTNEQAKVRINITDANYSLMNINCVPDIFQTQHNCTYPVELVGNHTFYFSAVNSLQQNKSAPLNNESKAYLIIAGEANISIYLNNLARDRKYEYGSNVTINLTSNSTTFGCVYIGGVNVSCVIIPSTFYYLLHPVFLFDFNNTLQTFHLNTLQKYKSNVTFSFRREVDFINASIHITNISNFRNLYIRTANVSHAVLIGNITNNTITIDRFLNRTQENITLEFTSAGTKVFNINISKNFIMYEGILKMIGLPVNPVAFYYGENFTNSSFINDSSSVGNYNLFPIEDYHDDERWVLSAQTNVNNKVDVSSISFLNQSMKLYSEQTSFTQDGSSLNDWSYTTNLNMSRFEKVVFNYFGFSNCSVEIGVGFILHEPSIYLTDSTGSIIPAYKAKTLRSYSDCNDNNHLYSDRVTFTNLGSGLWNFTENASTYSTILDLSAVNNVNILLNQVCNANNPYYYYCKDEISTINVTGFGLKSNPTPGNYTTNFNYTSNILFTAPSNIINAKLTVDTFNDFDADALFLYYMSANGVNWENVQSGVKHTFINTGTDLRIRVTGNLTTANSTHQNKSIGITKAQTELKTSFASNILFDFGQTSSVISINNSINNTNDAVLVNFTNKSNIIYNYVQTNITNQYGVIPVSVSSETAGSIILLNLSMTSNIGNILLNHTEFEKHCSNTLCDIDVEFTSDYSPLGQLDVTNISIAFKGDANLTVVVNSSSNGSVASAPRNMSVRYSKFNLTSPSPFFDFFPMTNNSKNVEPYGQNYKKNISIFNYTSLASTDSLDIWFRYNQTLDSCIYLWATNTSNSSVNQITVNTTYTKYLNNISVQTKGLYFWLNLTQCPSSISIYDPYYYFESHCSSCVPTWLSTNEWG